jgi:hypothetical protein
MFAPNKTIMHRFVSTMSQNIYPTKHLVNLQVREQALAAMHKSIERTNQNSIRLVRD